MLRILQQIQISTLRQYDIIFIGPLGAIIAKIFNDHNHLPNPPSTNKPSKNKHNNKLNNKLNDGTKSRLLLISDKKQVIVSSLAPTHPTNIQIKNQCPKDVDHEISRVYRILPHQQIVITENQKYYHYRLLVYGQSAQQWVNYGYIQNLKESLKTNYSYVYSNMLKSSPSLIDTEKMLSKSKQWIKQMQNRFNTVLKKRKSLQYQSLNQKQKSETKNKNILNVQNLVEVIHNKIESTKNLFQDQAINIIFYVPDGKHNGYDNYNILYKYHEVMAQYKTYTQEKQKKEEQMRKQVKKIKKKQAKILIKKQKIGQAKKECPQNLLASQQDKIMPKATNKKIINSFDKINSIKNKNNQTYVQVLPQTFREKQQQFKTAMDADEQIDARFSQQIQQIRKNIPKAQPSHFRNNSSNLMALSINNQSDNNNKIQSTEIQNNNDNKEASDNIFSVLMNTNVQPVQIDDQDMQDDEDQGQEIFMHRELNFIVLLEGQSFFPHNPQADIFLKKQLTASNIQILPFKKLIRIDYLRRFISIVDSNASQQNFEPQKYDSFQESQQIPDERQYYEDYINNRQTKEPKKIQKANKSMQNISYDYLHVTLQENTPKLLQESQINPYNNSSKYLYNNQYKNLFILGADIYPTTHSYGAINYQAHVISDNLHKMLRMKDFGYSYKPESKDHHSNYLSQYNGMSSYPIWIDMQNFINFSQEYTDSVNYQDNKKYMSQENTNKPMDTQQIKGSSLNNSTISFKNTSIKSSSKIGCLASCFQGLKRKWLLGKEIEYYYNLKSCGLPYYFFAPELSQGTQNHQFIKAHTV